MRKAEDAPVLPYRHKAEPVGVTAEAGEVPALVTFTVLGVAFAVGACFLLVDVLDEATSGHRPDGIMVLLMIGLAAMAAAVRIGAGRYLDRLRARRRLEILYCDRCGYDLRASRGRCPECGRPIPEGRDEVVRRLREMTGGGQDD